MLPFADTQSERDAAARLLQQRTGAVHLLGVSGFGMAGLAVLLEGRGFSVSGCDACPGALADWLAARGITCVSGHAVAHIHAGLAAVIRSTAVPDSDPEVQEAYRLGIPVFRRGAVLPAFLAGVRSVAVSGTHGKTTTSGFIAQLLRAAGAAPSWCIGGEIDALGGVAGIGTGDILVVEADESDGTVMGYHPDVAVVTNVEFDHMEHFADVAAFEACFRTFASQAKQVVYGTDDARARALCEQPGAVAFGLDQGEAHVADLRETPDGHVFTLVLGGRKWPEVTLPLPGRHNIQNLLAACLACRELGVDPDALVVGISELVLPKRRFERVSAGGGVAVFSDYAHHPTEIRALVQTARSQPHERLIAVFQPHRYTRTLALGADFPPAFEGVDELILLPVYAASEAPLTGGTVWDLYGHFRAREGAPGPRVATSLDEAWRGLKAILRAGDMLLVVGAGTVAQLAERARAEWGAAGPPARAVLPVPELSAESDVRHHETLAGFTSLGIGGEADVWVGVGAEADLIALVRWARQTDTPLTLLGGGYNTLVSDFGVRGVVVQLTGEPFHQIRFDAGQVHVGAAVTLADFLDALEAGGYAGFEFLQGIPGTMGGGMQMNAGAWGEGLGDHLVEIRCLNASGEICIVPADALDLGYRRCGYLRDHILLAATFVINGGDVAAIATRRADIRERRQWMDGYRSAGSFFKNPDGEKAGRLLEAVGMQGVRLGGGYVCEHHANFVIAEAGATCADILALTHSGRQAVLDRYGIELEAEVKFIQ